MSDRRQLDRDFEANWRRVNGHIEVYAGESVIETDDLVIACLLVKIHNKARNNQAFAERLRARVEVGA